MEQNQLTLGGDRSFLKLVSHNITLRKMELSDITSFHAYRSDPEVARYQSWEPTFSLDDATDFVNRQFISTPNIPGQWIQLSVSYNNSDVHVGDVAFCSNEYEPLVVEMGVTISPKYQKQHIAFDAITILLNYLFGDLGKHRVTALIDTRNIASVKLFTALGFRQEAHYIENTFFKGEYCSEYLFAILKREWDVLLHIKSTRVTKDIVDNV